MLFPQPTSARTLVRKTVASSLEQLGRVFASEVDAILAEEAKGRKGIVERPDMGDQLEGVEVSPKEKRVRILAERMLTIAVRTLPWGLVGMPFATWLTTMFVWIDAAANTHALPGHWQMGASVAVSHPFTSASPC